MVAKAADKATDTPTSTLKIGKVTELDAPMRGRGFSDEVLAVRSELEASLKDREGRSFDDVTDENKDELARIVRSAGKMSGRPEIKVSTRYAKNTGRLLWGPKEVMDELSKKGK